MGSTLPASGNESSIELSKKILLGGLITQVIALGFFILTCWYAHRRIKREPAEVLRKDSTINWRNHFRAVELVTLVLIVRSVVRTIEYLQGVDGFIASHEVFLYATDAFLMFFVMIVFLIIHPGRLIRDACHLKQDNWNPESQLMLKTR
ncbi:uncharacterized protein Z518_11243 [Rhinocladiella mackenziei CBS 650.93]|uniref:RTA1 domain protein n=1 Tax=Rhinocladiella mackenziei CBS 650.93 TaxID=1442369 RepID=A0A0D2IS35_9EURO|nr:uncharacterized protein Z518_11243 [Rhinocladiella mackenziei CBS 650.93]KIW99504.1 hypothetical protein Z518_11243 [Rhinocladiella mackenziei CBS 650.93]